MQILLDALNLHFKVQQEAIITQAARICQERPQEAVYINVGSVSFREAVRGGFDKSEEMAEDERQRIANLQ